MRTTSEGPISACYSVYTSRCTTLLHACPPHPSIWTILPANFLTQKRKEMFATPFASLMLWTPPNCLAVIHITWPTGLPSPAWCQTTSKTNSTAQCSRVLFIADKIDATYYRQCTIITLRSVETMICKHVSKTVQNTKAGKICFLYIFCYLLFFLYF
jgi:hypothetical protein